MEPNQSIITPTVAPPNFLQRNRMMVKALIIAGLILALWIPIVWIQGLVYERSDRFDEVVQEVSNRWAQSQTITGPILMIPYTQHQKLKSGQVQRTQGNAYVLPQKLNTDAVLEPSIRHRSLFEIVLYRSRITMNGTFDLQSLNKLNIAPEQYQWDKASLLLGVEDMRGIENNVNVSWGQENLLLEGGVPENKALKAGLYAPLKNLKPGQQIDFRTQLTLRGAQDFFLTASSKHTTATLHSTWKDPSFTGYFLPNNEPKISDSGFTASWDISNIAMAGPEAWLDAAKEQEKFGVKLLQPTGSYQKTTRAVKYALLFITLTFSVFFLLEIFQKKQVHPIQYTLVGLALCVFYALLLSFSEYMGFNGGYAVAATATAVLIAAYVRAVLKSWSVSALFGVCLAALYVYIFTLIQLSDYALLIGSIGLFLILALIMFITRKINWYGGAIEPATTASINA